MKNIFSIVFFILILLLIIYIYRTKKAINSLDYNIDLDSISLSDFSINDLSTTGSKIKARLKIDITNNYTKTLTFRNLNIVGFYKGKQIFNSNKDSLENFVKIKLETGLNTLYQVFDIYINKESFELIGNIKRKESSTINYIINVNWNGLKFSQNLDYNL